MTAAGYHTNNFLRDEFKIVVRIFRKNDEWAEFSIRYWSSLEYHFLPRYFRGIIELVVHPTGHRDEYSVSQFGTDKHGTDSID